MDRPAAEPHPRAWLCRAAGITVVVSATSRSKAMQAVAKAATEAGYDVRFVDVRARVAPEIDGAQIAKGICLSYEDATRNLRTEENR